MNKEKKFHVAIPADVNYSVPLALVALSLLHVSPSKHRYHFHILGDGVEESVLDDLRVLCDARCSKLTYYDVGVVIKGVVVTESFPAVAFARFLLPNLLPLDVDRVLYVDSDEFFRADPSALFDLDLGDFLLAAVQDFDFAGREQGPDYLRRICDVYDLEQLSIGTYYNAGQLMFNLPACRENRFCEKVFEMALNPKMDLEYPDQDIMNILARGRIISLPPQYCVAPHWHAFYQEIIQLKSNSSIYTADEVRLATENPVLIHFLTSSKPFVLYPCERWYGDFYRLWRSSPWKRQLPYLPYKIKKGVAVGSLRCKLMLMWMKALLYIPYGYELWWKLLAALPKALRLGLARACGWTPPDA